MIYSATVQRRRIVLTAGFLLLIGVGWGMRHIYSTVSAVNGQGTQFGLIFTAAFVMLALQMVLCFLERTPKVTDEEKAELDRLIICAQIPVHNEDVEALKADVLSILAQTRPVQLIDVVENGVNKIDYTEVQQWFYAECRKAGVTGTWRVTPAKGKRKAQGVTVHALRSYIDLYLTVDSDAVLAPNAVEELIKPFAKSDVFSAAGVVLALNNRKKIEDVKTFGQNLLCRMTDLWFVVGQLVDRSAQSAMGSVLVNSGVLAMYRAEVLEHNMDSYLHETFFGVPVEFSDDSMLTIYALQRGKAVQVPTAFAFTLMPETLDHHIRQYVRWMRGAFIRTWWRFKYLPMNRYAFWAHFIGWAQMILSTFIFFQLFVRQPVITGELAPILLLIPVLVGYMQSLRYFSFKRSDESLGSQILTFLLSPIATLWAFFVLRVVRWYAMMTCLRTGWGTRGDVEVGLRTTTTTTTTTT